MDIILRKSDFQKSVQSCMGVSPIRGVNPILCNILIETIGKDRVSLKATDTELGIIITFPAEEIREEGQVLINSKNLADVVRSLPEENVRLFSKTDSLVRLTSGKASFRFNCLSPFDFPRIIPFSEEGVIKVSSQALRNAITKTIFAVPVDKSRYSIAGAHFEIKEGRLSITTTDNYRLVHCYFDIEASPSIEMGIILPRKAFAEISKMVEGDDDISLMHSQNKLFATNKEKTLICQVMDGDFPDIVKAIPKENPNILNVNRSSIIASLRRVNVFSEDNALVFKINKNTLNIHSLDSERGGSSDEIDIEYSGEPMSIGFDSKYVLEVLNAMDEENIRIEMSSSTKPSLFRRCEDTTYSCVVMPMRLPESKQENNV